MVGVVKADIRRTATAKEIGLPRRVGRNAGDFVQLALVGHWVGRVRRCMGQHQVDAFVQDQILRHFRCAVGVGLAVFGDDFNLDRFAIVGHAGQRVFQASQDPILRLAKACQGAGSGGDKADFEHAVLRQSAVGTQNRGGRDKPRGGGDELAPCIGEVSHSFLPE